MEPIKRRGPFMTVFDLLRNMRQPVKKTNLQSITRVSGAEISKSLSVLLELGLVREVPYFSSAPRYEKLDKRTPYLYVVTEKGKDLIRLYERIYDILGWSAEK